MEEGSEEFELKNKVTYVVTDNAAFQTRFPNFENEAADDCDVMEKVDDDLHIFEGLSEADELAVQAAVESTTKRRISCFVHTLQLLVADRLKDAKSLYGPWAKASRLSTLLHRSTILKERSTFCYIDVHYCDY